jgi:hypothetical protein
MTQATTLYQAARERFNGNPRKCFQRHIRELHAEQEPRHQLTSLRDAVVERIPNKEAEHVILKYEWLGTMGNATRASYGLKMDGELLGVACYGAGGSREAQNICGEQHIAETICLQRGACVPWAPKNAASFLIRHACRAAHKNFGWKVFFAYSDPEAGEIGTVYQAVGWHYLGANLGRQSGSIQINWRTQEGKVFSSQWANKRRLSKLQCLARGWHPVAARPKGKYIWFEDKGLEKHCRYEFLPYPKRSKE